jgi:hypothetical protein
MTLEEFKKNIDALIKAHPFAAKLTVVYAVDDEGNNFDWVKFTPSLMKYDEHLRDSDNPAEATQVCIN